MVKYGMSNTMAANEAATRYIHHGIVLALRRPPETPKGSCFSILQ